MSPYGGSTPSESPNSDHTHCANHLPSASGSGITHTIRDHLGFTDDKKWKEFSTRRLELIDKFDLSSKKASEQDDDIKQIANMLREEFGFAPSTLADFDKLVRAAIQSVRRNRKRSSRARVHNDRFVMVQDDPQRTRRSSITNPNTSLFGNQQQQQQQQQQPLFQNPRHLSHPQPVIPPTLSTATNNYDNRFLVGSMISGTSPNNTATSSLSTSLSTSPNSTLLPPFKNLTATNKSTNPERSNYSRQKLLNFIQKSKSCLLLSNNDNNINEDNVLVLGKSILTASVSFVLERFFSDISRDSIAYLNEKLTHPSSLSKFFKSLGGLYSTDLLILTDIQATNLFAKLTGCCVKDFGFDAISYTLGEIFHEIILNEYPLIGTQVTKITQETLFTPLLPMVPKDADMEVIKEVKLRFGNKSLEFKYHPLSSAPPTYLELIDNGKVGFGLLDGRNVRLKYLGDDICLDSELERIFKDLNIKVIELEIYEVEKSKPPSGVKFTPLL